MWWSRKLTKDSYGEKVEKYWKIWKRLKYGERQKKSRNGENVKMQQKKNENVKYGENIE